jgi:hypothetical protein
MWALLRQGFTRGLLDLLLAAPAVIRPIVVSEPAIDRGTGLRRIGAPRVAPFPQAVQNFWSAHIDSPAKIRHHVCLQQRGRAGGHRAST